MSVVVLHRNCIDTEVIRQALGIAGAVEVRMKVMGNGNRRLPQPVQEFGATSLKANTAAGDSRFPTPRETRACVRCARQRLLFKKAPTARIGGTGRDSMGRQSFGLLLTGPYLHLALTSITSGSWHRAIH
jgi:hypothetical protein